MSLSIDSLQVIDLATSAFSVTQAIRTGPVVSCEADVNAFPLERFVVEFESEELAIAFYNALEDESALIQIDEDHSLAAAPPSLREEYLKFRDSGDKDKLEEVLTELWEDYGIEPEKEIERETSGIKRIAIMCDDGVWAWGFKRKKKLLSEWMTAHRFPQSGRIISMLD